MLPKIPRDRAPGPSLLHASWAADYFTKHGFKVLGNSQLNGKRPAMLAYAPFARNNMFQSLLYRDAFNEGFIPSALPMISDLQSLPWPGEIVCHIHWLAQILSGAPKKAPPAVAIDRFASLLSSLKSEGRKIVWTVHNVLPHDEEEKYSIEIRKLISSAADAVHIMNKSTIAESSKFFDIDPNKTFYCEHPSYIGAYPDHVVKDEARYQLGLGVDKKVCLAFGGLQPYKGLPELVHSYKKIATKDTCLLIAGPPVDDAIVEFLREISLRREDIIVYPHKIPVEDVQYFFRSADFSVCAYRKTLNSGAAMLSMSFGVPVVVPAISGFEDLVKEGRGVLYNDKLADGLVKALSCTFEGRADLSPLACSEYADRARPSIVSPKFFARLRTALWPN